MEHRQIALLVLSIVSGLPVGEPALLGLSLNLPGLGSDIKWNSLKVKYDPPFIGRFKIPLSTGKIGKEYQFLQAHEDLHLVSLYTYKDDPRVQLMYDAHGNICGMRVAYIKAHIQNRTPKGEAFPYSYNKPIFKNGFAMGKEFYYIDVFFIHPDILKNGGPASRQQDVGTGVYIKMDGKTWMEMPIKEKDAKSTAFTKQACFLGMGLHYFYNMTKEMKCEDHNPVFLLYHGGELIGLGLIPFGTFDNNFGRPWFEDPPKWVINTIVPKAPKCLADWVDQYGTTSIHIYFRQFNELTCVL